MKIRVVLLMLVLVCSPRYEATAQQPRTEAKPVSSALPAPQALSDFAAKPVTPPAQAPGDRPVPPPPPQTLLFSIPVAIGAATPANQWVTRTVQLPGGQISFKWLAVGPGNVDVTNDIEVAVTSPSMWMMGSINGSGLLMINQGGGNVTVAVRKRKTMGPVSASVTVDIVTP
jgi:hypothetical protein